MPVIQWGPDLGVGIEVIDFDHEVLVSLINLLADSVADKDGFETVGSVLNMLADYTEYHFGREEAIMAACGYAGLDDHKRVHAGLKQRVMEIRGLHDANPGMVLTGDLMDFLTRWLREHIQGRDRKYLSSLKGKDALIMAASEDFDARQPLVSGPFADEQEFLFGGNP